MTYYVLRDPISGLYWTSLGWDTSRDMAVKFAWESLARSARAHLDTDRDVALVRVVTADDSCPKKSNATA